MLRIMLGQRRMPPILPHAAPDLSAPHRPYRTANGAFMIGQWPQPSLLLEYGVVGMLCEPIFLQPITEAKISSGGQLPTAAGRTSLSPTRSSSLHASPQRFMASQTATSPVSLRFTATIVTILQASPHSAPRFPNAKHLASLASQRTPPWAAPSPTKHPILSRMYPVPLALKLTTPQGHDFA